MKEKKQNEELQSRREFFKEAAKKALPVIGAIALASSPIIANAAESVSMGCNGYCSQHCSAGCASTCTGRCVGNCQNTCSGTCTDACARGCAGYCNHSCKGGCSSSAH